MREMESGQSTNKADILYRFLEDPKSKLVFKEKIMKIAAVPEKHLMDPPKDDTQPSSGKLIRINKRNIRALAGSKYDRESKFSQLSKAKLRAALPPETTCDDVETIQKVLSASIANTTASNYKSVRNKFLKVFPERNCLQNPKFGDDVLLLGRLLRSPGLKKKTVKQYMKCFKTLILMEGATPAADFPHYKQLLKGVTNISHNPMAFVAHRTEKLTTYQVLGLWDTQ